MKSRHLEVVFKNKVTTLTLTNPEKRNPLSFETLQNLEAALSDLKREKESKVVILASTGPVFSAGHHLTELKGLNANRARSLFALCTRVMLSLRQLPQPVIASVQGFATAAGCQLVAGCDLAIAAKSAAFATPGVKLGLFCSSPAVPISRALPVKKTLEMLFTGKPISSEEALHGGFVNRVVPDKDLKKATMKLALEIVEYSASTLADGKQAFYHQISLSEPDAYRFVEKTMVDHLQTADAQEGITAFLEKRKPVWK